MPLAVTHIILTIVLIDIYRDYFAKKKFPMFFVLVGGISGLLPDIDIPISWFLSFVLQRDVWLHRLFTHTLLFPVLFAVVALVFYKIKKSKFKLFRKSFTNKRAGLFFLMVSIGWLIHIILDCSLAGGEGISWIPFIAPINFCPHWLSYSMLAGIDAVILVLWLIHEYRHHEIKDYI